MNGYPIRRDDGVEVHRRVEGGAAIIVRGMRRRGNGGTERRAPASSGWS